MKLRACKIDSPSLDANGFTRPGSRISKTKIHK